jgi:hypothetical protein
MNPRCWLALALALPFAAAAQDAIYRCTDAAGNLTVQNKPCPAGMREQKQLVPALKTAPSVPPPPAATATPAPALPANTLDPASAGDAQEYRILDSAVQQPVAAPALTRDTTRLPPPNLFQCRTYDDDGYISEDPQPPPRCTPLRTVGLDGNPRGGAGAACEMKQDQCVRVPDGALCDAWRKRLGETEVAWRFGRTEHAEKNRTEYERVKRIVEETSCGL